MHDLNSVIYIISTVILIKAYCIISCEILAGIRLVVQKSQTLH